MAAGTIYRGENLRIKINDDRVYHATSCSLSITSNTEELSSKDIAGTEISMGNYSGTLTTDVLMADKPATPVDYTDPGELIDLQLNKTLVDWEFTTGVTGDIILSGKAYVTQSDLTAENNQAATGSFTFLVSGDITRSVVA